MADHSAAANSPSRTPWALLALPAAVTLYAILGALWHPLLLGPGGFDSFECDRAPWDFVVLGAWLLGALLVLAAIVVAVMRRARTSLAFAVTGILLIGAGTLVFAVVGANEYHACSS